LRSVRAQLSRLAFDCVRHRIKRTKSIDHLQCRRSAEFFGARLAPLCP
jgi:hypothetical protein